jgi:hypothetical protein
MDRLGSLLMLRPCIIAVAVMLVGLSTPHAADTVLTLACQGTTTDTAIEGSKPEPISMGIVVNFTAQTVAGFTYPGAFPVTFTVWDDLHILFSGSNQTYWSTSGSIDRVTGDTFATSTWSNPQTGKVSSSTEYALKCRPAQRMF